MLPILLSAAMALPLPEGRGGARMVPLTVASSPPGATALVRYRDTAGAERNASCVTPCVLLIPRASPFIFDVVKDDAPLSKPAIAWGFKGFSGPNLYPSAVMARLPGASQ